MRLPRFRLSTLMLLVVIAALATALVVQQGRSVARQRLRAEEQRRVAEKALYQAEMALARAAASSLAPPPPAPAGGTGASRKRWP